MNMTPYSPPSGWPTTRPPKPRPMKQPKGKYAGIARVGEKGQIVIPKGVRDLFDIKPGDTLLVLADVQQGIVITKDDVLFQQFNAILGAEDPT